MLQILFMLMVELESCVCVSADGPTGRPICSNSFPKSQGQYWPIRDIFNWSLKFYFGSLCSLLLLESSPNRMIRGNLVGCILDMWRMVASMLGRDVRKRIFLLMMLFSQLMQRILRSFICWNCSRCLISHQYKVQAS